MSAGVIYALCKSPAYYLFIGTYNRDKNKDGIYIYRFDPGNGTLQQTSSVSQVLNPAYLIPSTNGHYIYACTEAQTPGAGSVSSFVFDPVNGKATFINSQPSGGENPVYLTEHNSRQWLAVANYTGGSTSVFRLPSRPSICLLYRRALWHGVCLPLPARAAGQPAAYFSAL